MDDDNDGILDTSDNCPFTASLNLADNDKYVVVDSEDLTHDSDGMGDICDTDDDSDGLEDKEDNCPLAANPDQQDTDK